MVILYDVSFWANLQLISTLNLHIKLLWKNDRNAKQRHKRLHLKVGDLKSDNQDLYPGNDRSREKIDCLN